MRLWLGSSAIASRPTARKCIETRSNGKEQRQFEREEKLVQEVTKKEEDLLRDAALQEERLQKEAEAQRSNAFAR